MPTWDERLTDGRDQDPVRFTSHDPWGRNSHERSGRRDGQLAPDRVARRGGRLLVIVAAANAHLVYVAVAIAARLRRPPEGGRRHGRSYRAAKPAC